MGIGRLTLPLLFNTYLLEREIQAHFICTVPVLYTVQYVTVFIKGTVFGILGSEIQ